MMAHINNGFFVIPGLALLLLIISFFTKVRGATGPSSCSCWWLCRSCSASSAMSSPG